MKIHALIELPDSKRPNEYITIAQSRSGRNLTNLYKEFVRLVKEEPGRDIRLIELSK